MSPQDQTQSPKNNQEVEQNHELMVTCTQCNEKVNDNSSYNWDGIGCEHKGILSCYGCFLLHRIECKDTHPFNGLDWCDGSQYITNEEFLEIGTHKQ